MSKQSKINSWKINLHFLRNGKGIRHKTNRDGQIFGKRRIEQEQEQERSPDYTSPTPIQSIYIIRRHRVGMFDI